ncbi:MAG: hypothetical protein Kow00121_62700 [Elainellaceae cyanobacterium]
MTLWGLSVAELVIGVRPNNLSFVYVYLTSLLILREVLGEGVYLNVICFISFKYISKN